MTRLLLLKPGSRWLSLLLSAMSLSWAPVASAQDRCPATEVPYNSPFCAELVPVPTMREAQGMLELHAARSPFGVAVTPDGRLRQRIVVRIDGLPPAHTLGPYTAYVAWGYDLSMGREVRLGRVTNGRTLLGELSYEQFRLVVSAERVATVPSRRGPLILRATSPSAMLLAHRDAILPMSGVATTTNAAEHATHDPAATWPMPPDDPRIAPMGMVHTPPQTAPYLPSIEQRGLGTVKAGVETARPREVLDARNGDTLTLRAGLVRRTIAGKTFIGYGYNGQYPGPLVRVKQGSELVIRLFNALDLPTTIHWHGVRLDNRFDGVPHLTQNAVAPGDSFTYVVRFPDAGIYWYHPHVREDIQQELGLYGNILVARRARQQVPVHREEILALDDFLMGDAGPAPLGKDVPTHALMGRFGNVLLINGEPSWTTQARVGEVVRFYLTNVSNARTFNLGIPGARLKLVGSDLGDFEREEWVESIVLAPAERYIVEAQFARAGTFAFVNAVQWFDHMRGTLTPVVDTLGTIVVGGERARPDYSATFAQVRAHADVMREFAALRRGLPRQPAHHLTLGVRTHGLSPLLSSMLSGVPVPVDWNDAMPMMNWGLTSHEVTWVLRDESGRENMDIRWRFRTGDRVLIRLRNDPAALHAMAHPIHFHGQRFAVVSRNGVPNDNLVWKDTALLPAGEMMDILVEMTNPGQWMVHCHVAEHLGTGMMLVFEVL